MLWITDPKTKESSVSLTILILFTVCNVVAAFLQVFGKVSTVSVFPEMFYSSVALYFGRRLSINGKAFTSEKAESIEEKVK